MNIGIFSVRHWILSVFVFGIGFVFQQRCVAGSSGFSATGSFVTARGNHRTTLLNDGNVLVTGGSETAPNSAELYHRSFGDLGRHR